MVGLAGHRFETFEQLRDYAQSQIDAASAAVVPATADNPNVPPAV